MAKKRKKRVNYTDAQRTKIMAAAHKDHLTAAQVQKEFGVTPVTYYSWRKKSGVSARRRGGAALTVSAGTDIAGQVRAEVKSKVRQILPGIVRTEVSSYLDSLFGAKRGRAKRL